MTSLFIFFIYWRIARNTMRIYKVSLWLEHVFLDFKGVTHYDYLSARPTVNRECNFSISFDLVRIGKIVKEIGVFCPQEPAVKIYVQVEYSSCFRSFRRILLNTVLHTKFDVRIGFIEILCVPFSSHISLFLFSVRNEAWIHDLWQEPQWKGQLPLQYLLQTIVSDSAWFEVIRRQFSRSGFLQFHKRFLAFECAFWTL